MKRIFSLLATLIIAFGLVASLAPKAEAASDCHTAGGIACFYDGISFTGARVVIPDGPYGYCQIGDLYSYWASFLSNNSINTQRWYTGVNLTGSSLTVSPQAGRASLSSTYNNNLRSWSGTCYGGVRIAGSGYQSCNGAIRNRQGTGPGGRQSRGSHSHPAQRMARRYGAG